MGHMSSPVAKISNYDFKPIPNSLKVDGKIFKMNGITVIMGLKGGLYTNCAPLNLKIYCNGIRSWSIPVFEALKEFGLLTKEEIEIHDDYLKRKTEQDKLHEMIYQIHNAFKYDNPAVTVNHDIWLELWNRLDYYNQKKNIAYKPAKGKLKRKPRI